MSTSSGWRERTTYSRIRVAANVLLAVAASQSIACHEPAPPPTETGQWIWSTADSAQFADASRVIPALVPTVWIGTIAASARGTIESRLALSPRLPGRPSVDVVVRFEDGFSNVWSTSSDSTVATELDASLARLLGAAAASGVTIREVQLDYDCPERLLARWSTVVAALGRGALAGRTVWLTSLVTHVRQRDYGDLFRAHVTGHILQVFDTGDRMSLPYARQVLRLAARHRMPFRLGIGAFERRLPNGGTTDHRAWFAADRVMRASPWYRGVWVFPGGTAWAPLLEQHQ